MFRYPNPTHYVNALGAKAKRRQGQKAKPKGGYQPKGKAKRGGPQPQRRTRRRMRDEIQPYAVGPDGRVYLAGGAEFPVPRLQQNAPRQPFQALNQQNAPRQQIRALDQMVHTNPGGKKLFVKKQKGTRRAVEFDENKKPNKGPDYSGPTIYKNQVWITKGNTLRPATADELASVVKYKNRHVKQERKSEHHASIKQGPHQVFDMIGQAKPALNKGCKDGSSESFDTFKDRPMVGQILDKAREFAEMLMNRGGFFADLKENYKPGPALQYIHNGSKLAGLEFKKTPAFLENFDRAWNNGDGTMTEQDRFKAARSFMAVLGKNVVGAILSTLRAKELKKEKDQLANAVAKHGHVANTGDALQNAREAAAKIISGEEDVHMGDGDSTELIVKQICIMLSDQIEGNITVRKIQDYIVNNRKLALSHFMNEHFDAFERKAKNTKKNKKGTEAEASIVPTTASRGLNLVSMRS